jgi:hypothetical protein
MINFSLFDVRIIKQKTFSLFIYGYSVINTAIWSLLIRLGIQITASLKMTSSVKAIRVPMTRLSYVLSRIIGLTSTIKMMKTMRVAVVAKATSSLVLNSFMYMRNVFVVNLRFPSIWGMVVKSPLVTTISILATVYTLLDFDPNALSANDVMTLAQMDYLEY